MINSVRRYSPWKMRDDPLLDRGVFANSRPLGRQKLKGQEPAQREHPARIGELQAGTPATVGKLAARLGNTSLSCRSCPSCNGMECDSFCHRGRERKRNRANALGQSPSELLPPARLPKDDLANRPPCLRKGSLCVAANEVAPNRYDGRFCPRPPGASSNQSTPGAARVLPHEPQRRSGLSGSMDSGSMDSPNPATAEDEVEPWPANTFERELSCMPQGPETHVRIGPIASRSEPGKVSGFHYRIAIAEKVECRQRTMSCIHLDAPSAFDRSQGQRIVVHQTANVIGRVARAWKGFGRFSSFGGHS
jgi:hypothetical protein